MAAGGARARRPRRRVDGVLLLDKPAGLSSNAALQRAKRLFAAEKAGHTGTLDPLATGPPAALLRRGDQVRAGAARRARRSTSRRCASASRRPPATPKAKSCARATRAFSRAELEAALPRFVGPIVQMPPAFAALKFAGPHLLRIRARRHRDSARRRARSRSTRSSSSTGRRRTRVLRVACGKGTYIRVLAEDIAARARHAAPTSPRCGAPPPDRFALDGRGDAGGARGDGRRRRATRCCCRPTPRCPAWRGSTSTRRRRRRCVDGRAGPAPPDASRTLPLLRPGGTLPRAGRSRPAARCARCASRARTRG